MILRFYDENGLHGLYAVYCGIFPPFPFLRRFFIRREAQNIQTFTQMTAQELSMSNSISFCRQLQKKKKEGRKRSIFMRSWRIDKCRAQNLIAFSGEYPYLHELCSGERWSKRTRDRVAHVVPYFASIIVASNFRWPLLRVLCYYPSLTSSFRIYEWRGIRRNGRWSAKANEGQGRQYWPSWRRARCRPVRSSLPLSLRRAIPLARSLARLETEATGVDEGESEYVRVCALAINFSPFFPPRPSCCQSVYDYRVSRGHPMHARC